MKYLFVALGISVALLTAQQAQAVPPPDFIFNAGSAIAQVFSLVFLFLSVAMGSVYQFIKVRLVTRRDKAIFFTVASICILALAVGIAYVFNSYYQKSQYQQWLAKSRQMTEQVVEQGVATSGPGAMAATGSVDNVLENNPLDTLTFGKAIEATSTRQAKFESRTTQPLDAVGRFIGRYYSDIGYGNLEAAYKSSKHVVPFATFRSWYASTTRIVIDKLQRIDATRSSLELTLQEGLSATRYGVLMTVRLVGDNPVQIQDSQVRVLDSSQSTDKQRSSTTTASEDASQEVFFDAHQNIAPTSTDAAFRNAIASGQDNYIVVDARENVEYENGNFPGSLHIRYADLQAGRWIELPRDKYVYVFCWSGIRGLEVAKFLRSKKILALSLDGGAKGWVDGGGSWNGDIMFKKKYSDARYQRLFTTQEAKDQMQSGVFVVDSREPYKFKQWHIPGSVNIPLMYTPTIRVENAMAQVPSGAKVITVCDAYVNCFDANITAVELERRGHEFLGRYSQPWEMRTK